MEGGIVLLLLVSSVGVLMVPVKGLECYTCEYSKQGDILSGDEMCLSNPTSVNVTKCSEESKPACIKTYRENEDTGFESVARGCSFEDQAPFKKMRCTKEDRGDLGKGTYCFCNGDKCNAAATSCYLNLPLVMLSYLLFLVLSKLS